MKAKLKLDVYPSWKGLKGKIITVIPYGAVGYMGEIASANAQGATDDPKGGCNKVGYRYLGFMDVTIVGE